MRLRSRLFQKSKSSLLRPSVAAITAVFSVMTFEIHTACASTYDADEVIKEINSGWPRQVTSLNLDPKRNYIVIAMSPPSTPLDLRSAEHFRQTLIGAHWTKSTIGHAMVGWQCVGPNGELRKGFTGITGEHSDQAKTMAFSGWGATAFISTFTDGTLQSPVGAEAAMNLALDRGRKINIIAMEVSAQDCLNSAEFVSQFIRHPTEPLHRFGLALDPAKFEGGGCGSFAVSVANQAGFWNSVSPLFWRSLQIPRSLMGRRTSAPPPNTIPNYPWSTDRDVEVQLNTLQESPWVPRPDDQITEIRLVDPEIMLLTTRTLRELAKPRTSGTLNTPSIEERIVRSAVPHATHDGDHPKTEYYYRWTKIDENFDAQTAQAVQATKEWWEKASRSGYRMTAFDHDNIAGVRIELKSR